MSRERIEELLKQMTPDEKFRCLTVHSPEIARLGLPEFFFGGEAAHGVEARHDQEFNKGEPAVTTSFPQPIGMSASFNTELIRQAGAVVGTEARALYKKEGKTGLSRWAPTVDLCRDPRWGRTEEGYGEDPYLTGKMASAYIRGMQGEDPFFLRCAATLKHFYANNTEDDRAYASSELTDEDKEDFYLEPFRLAVTEGRAESVMTSYNEINRVPAIVNPEINELLRDKWGLHGHVVCDMGDLGQTVSEHHYCETAAQALAAAMKVGVDVFNDPEEEVVAAAREAYETGLITLEDINEALRHSFSTKFRLGVYRDGNKCPYDAIGESELNTKEHQAVALQMAREAVVLLKNERRFLPFDRQTRETIAVIGPLADVWNKDWYSGIPYNPVTPLAGIRQEFSRADLLYDDGCDRVRIRQKDGTYLAFKNKEICGVCEASQAELFRVEVWEEERHVFYAEQYGRYLHREYESGILKLERTEAFSWFAEEAFSLQESGFSLERVENGKERAIRLAARADKVIAVMGCHPIISCKEGVDRKDIEFPAMQHELVKALYEANPHTALVLITNYPYAIRWEASKLPAILMTASGGQCLGRAVAEALSGAFSPSGRLNMTWHNSAKDLPPMNDYHIREGKRTYQYFEGEVLFPFGHGLSYTEFTYLSYEVREKNGRISGHAVVKNTGSVDAAEVVLFFLTRKPRDTSGPIKKLVGFRKIFLKSEETARVEIN